MTGLVWVALPVKRAFATSSLFTLHLLPLASPRSASLALLLAGFEKARFLHAHTRPPSRPTPSKLPAHSIRRSRDAA